MRLDVGSCTWFGVHSPEMLMRHNLDWRLQTDQRYHLFFLHDGPVEGREDKVSVEDIDYGANTTFTIYPERRKFWGAYARKEWLESLDPEEYPFVYFCCADDQIVPIMVERVLQEFTRFPELVSVMFQTPHHHYTYGLIPLGVGPYVNRADWASGVLRTSLAKKAGINFPEDYAADGLFWQDCLSVSGGDDSLFRVLNSSLVFKN